MKTVIVGAHLLALAALMLTVVVQAQEADTAKVTPLEVEAEICTGIEERMPTDPADTLPSAVGQVYCWSKVKGAQDTTAVEHRWFYQDSLMATVELPVRSPSWRTWSSKRILPSWTGAWEVRITDMAGNILKSVTFVVR